MRHFKFQSFGLWTLLLSLSVVWLSHGEKKSMVQRAEKQVSAPTGAENRAESEAPVKERTGYEQASLCSQRKTLRPPTHITPGWQQQLRSRLWRMSESSLGNVGSCRSRNRVGADQASSDWLQVDTWKVNSDSWASVSRESLWAPESEGESTCTPLM